MKKSMTTKKAVTQCPSCGFKGLKGKKVVLTRFITESIKFDYESIKSRCPKCKESWGYIDDEEYNELYIQACIKHLRWMTDELYSQGYSTVALCRVLGLPLNYGYKFIAAKGHFDPVLYRLTTIAYYYPAILRSMDFILKPFKERKSEKKCTVNPRSGRRNSKKSS